MPKQFRRKRWPTHWSVAAQRQASAREGRSHGRRRPGPCMENRPLGRIGGTGHIGRRSEGKGYPSGCAAERQYSLPTFLKYCAALGLVPEEEKPAKAEEKEEKPEA